MGDKRIAEISADKEERIGRRHDIAKTESIEEGENQRETV